MASQLVFSDTLLIYLNITRPALVLVGIASISLGPLQLVYGSLRALHAVLETLSDGLLQHHINV